MTLRLAAERCSLDDLKMNYQLLLEYLSCGTELSELELQLLDLELYSQLESLKVSSSEGCLKVRSEEHTSKSLFL